MLISGMPWPAATPRGQSAGAAAKAPQDPPAAARPAASKPAAVDPEVSAAMARAEDAADKSRTARRDALAAELTRLMEIARKLDGAGGDLRSSADALQDLARQIAKVARALADAERALPAAQRRGVPPVAVPRAQPAAAAAPAEAKAGKAPAAEVPAAEVPAADTKAAEPDSAAADDDPLDPAPLDPEKRDEERRERARAGRTGTGELLKLAAGLLDEIRKTVRKAELFETLLDPEAAKERREAGAEIAGFANELRNLAAGFADPAQGLGVDVTA